ncbi:hypothetical protein [Actinoplanes regularis]|uniref:Lipoprotein n=1 Tax=Actinoplanes regularis TaxID=52697 RepID=A0A238YEF8_9ACTN|nr:hypothetical protein [Actinoplanes regularis]GIE85990.1 hypothetical protein Are01nite_24700 [Actinoplanes regularis]SNR68974.1 hypothetical protein SAMN06264365_104458 [Actinoplanes regularis]
MNVRRSATVLVAAGSMLLATGCESTSSEAGPTQRASASVSPSPADNGVAALSATQILERAQTALVDAKSFHLSGNVHDDDADYWIDLKQSGANMLGSAEFGGMKLEVLLVDGQGYVRMDEDMLAGGLGAEAAKKLAPRLSTSWIKPDKASFKEMASAFDVGKILKPAGKLTKGEVKLSNQRSVITLVDAGGDYDELHIATTGEPLPLKIVGGGRALFAEFGADFPEIKAPAAKQIIEMPGKTRKS